MVDLASLRTTALGLVHWERPLASGSTLGCVLALLVSVCYFSFIAVVAYISLVLLVIVLCVKVYSYVMVFMNKAEPGSDPLIAITNLEVSIAPEKVAEVTGFLVDVVNPSIMELRRLFLLENWLDTIKFVLCLWGFTYIGSWFNMITLLILSWVALFTLPLLYKNNQAAVDEIVGTVNTQMTDIKEKIQSVIPTSAKKEE